MPRKRGFKDFKCSDKFLFVISFGQIVFISVTYKHNGTSELYIDFLVQNVEKVK